MVQKNSIFISLCAFCVVFFASCGSTPKPEPEAPVALPSEVTEEQSTQDSAVNQNILLFSDIENERKAAIDAGAEDYLPEQLAELDAAANDLKLEEEQEPGKDIAAAVEELKEKYRLLAEDSKAEQVKPEKTAAIQAKERVDSIMPVKPEKEVPYDAAVSYEEAVAAFAQGDTNFNSGNIEAARSEYQNSRDTFDDIFKRESEKQAAEAEAQRQAEAKLQAEIQRLTQIEAAVKQAEAAAVRAEAAAKLAEERLKAAEAAAQRAEAAAKLAEDNAKVIQAIEDERQAELKRIADEEAARLAELQRIAEEEAEAARLEAEQRFAEEEAARLAAEEARLRSYTVQTGDSYSKIAGELYEDQTLWPQLYEANRDKMRDPNNPHLIYPDMILDVPRPEGE